MKLLKFIWFILFSLIKLLLGGIIGALALFWISGLLSLSWITVFTLEERLVWLELVIIIAYYIPAIIWVLIRLYSEWIKFNDKCERNHRS